MIRKCLSIRSSVGEERIFPSKEWDTEYITPLIVTGSSRCQAGHWGRTLSSLDINTNSHGKKSACNTNTQYLHQRYVMLWWGIQYVRDSDVSTQLSTVRHDTALLLWLFLNSTKPQAPWLPWHWHLCTLSCLRVSQSEDIWRASDQSEDRKVSPVIPCQHKMTLGLLHTLDIHSYQSRQVQRSSFLLSQRNDQMFINNIIEAKLFRNPPITGFMLAIKPMDNVDKRAEFIWSSDGSVFLLQSSYRIKSSILLEMGWDEDYGQNSLLTCPLVRFIRNTHDGVIKPSDWSMHPNKGLSLVETHNGMRGNVLHPSLSRIKLVIVWWL